MICNHTRVNGKLINYYFHCKRQCYLHGNRLNLEDNSELVQIGRAIHEVKSADHENTEIIRKGKLEFEEKNKTKKAALFFELGEAEEKELERIQTEIEELLQSDMVPEADEQAGCKNCAYYEYCFI